MHIRVVWGNIVLLVWSQIPSGRETVFQRILLLYVSSVKLISLTLASSSAFVRNACKNVDRRWKTIKVERACSWWNKYSTCFAYRFADFDRSSLKKKKEKKTTLSMFKQRRRGFSFPLRNLWFNGSIVCMHTCVPGNASVCEIFSEWERVCGVSGACVEDLKNACVWEKRRAGTYTKKDEKKKVMLIIRLGRKNVWKCTSLGKNRRANISGSGDDIERESVSQRKISFNTGTEVDRRPIQNTVDSFCWLYPSSCFPPQI